MTASTSPPPVLSSETDDDGGTDLLLLPGWLTRSSKGANLSSSSQSTLCGFAVTQVSSRESPAEVVYKAAGKDDDGATWNLLYKAAGEVTRMKLGSKSARKVRHRILHQKRRKRLLCVTNDKEDEEETVTMMEIIVGPNNY